MNLQDYPEAVAVATRIRQEQGIDPLDEAKVTEAAKRYADARSYYSKSGGRGGAMTALSIMLLIIAATAAAKAPVSLVVTLPLFALSLIPTVRAIRRFGKQTQQMRSETLPYIVGYIQCLRATSADPKTQDRLELQWRSEHRLAALPGTHYKVPSA
jgi:hypothetical protein